LGDFGPQTFIKGIKIIMTEWNPQVVKIEKVVNHPNADALDVVTVLGDYPVIVKRNEYKVGDLAAYIPIDSIVPDTTTFYFLCPKDYEKYEEGGVIKQRQTGPKYPIGSVPEKNRIIKAKSIRNVYSQGMLIPLPDPIPNDFPTTGHKPWREGDSVADAIGLKKWEEPEEENIVDVKLKRANAEKAPVGWSIPYYDIEGVRKYLDCLRPDEEIVLTEKIHGSNASFCHDGTKLWVKSRNYYQKFDPDTFWWDIAVRYDLENKLAQFPNYVFFGEIYGQVKGFKYDCKLENGKMPTKIRFFDIFNLKDMRYVDYDQFLEMIRVVGLEATPELYRGLWLGKELMYPYAEGLTTLGAGHIREGFVLRTAKERFEPKLQSRMQVKLVGEGYNLQK
jgi:RNA ligase (TIGR02306 family)